VPQNSSPPGIGAPRLVSVCARGVVGVLFLIFVFFLVKSRRLFC